MIIDDHKVDGFIFFTRGGVVGKVTGQRPHVTGYQANTFHELFRGDHLFDIHFKLSQVYLQI
ncbi:MAG TPA: hypothetical protein PL029_11195, partial [Bacteroidia bacterium]|nr:hypothetical protein [Bacteroidia bacterium]